MSQRTPVWRVLAALATLSLVAGACGDNNETTEGTTDTTAAEGTTTAPPQNEGDGTLKIGTLLPETGSLAFLGPPEFAGVDLAVQEINEAGGVLGEDVEVIDGDSGDTSTDIANQTTDRLLSQNVDVIVGAASSGVSFTVIDKITGAGVVQFSPANTSPDFTDYDDDGLYFRTAPSDVLQGRILGELIIDEGNATVGIVALQDPYGEGLAENVAKTIEDSGGEVVATEIYDPQAQNFDAEVQALVSADPEAIVVIGFDESARIISTMIEQGIGPDDKNVYTVDGNTGNSLGEQLPEGALEGIKGTVPGAETTEEFRQRLLEIDPNLEDFVYAGEAYDAVVVSALAAEVAESDAGRDIAENIPDVTRDGEKCTTFAECKQLLDAGEDIDYDGISGPIELDDVGDPTFASIGIYTFGADNKLSDDVTYREGEL
ncbi:MAG TPA: ABC transporter substrate-binding protein [Acidimicrobiales bacterium]|nr:ABC transporter substrate-binding protein [Acidimicrobiales bacterium]